MKKKIIVLVIALLVVCCSLFALTACNNDTNDCAVQINEKYVTRYLKVSNITVDAYYTFGNDGYGVYGYTMTSTNTHMTDPNGQSHYYDEYKFGYKIYFKYTYLDNDKETIMAFYDSVALNSDNTIDISLYPDYDYAASYSTWRSMLTLSKNVIIEISDDDEMNYYIREGYLNEVPNYNIGK